MISRVFVLAFACLFARDIREVHRFASTYEVEKSFVKHKFYFNNLHSACENSEQNQTKLGILNACLSVCHPNRNPNLLLFHCVFLGLY